VGLAPARLWRRAARAARSSARFVARSSCRATVAACRAAAAALSAGEAATVRAASGGDRVNLAGGDRDAVRCCACALGEAHRGAASGGGLTAGLRRPRFGLACGFDGSVSGSAAAGATARCPCTAFQPPFHPARGSATPAFARFFVFLRNANADDDDEGAGDGDRLEEAVSEVERVAAARGCAVALAGRARSAYGDDDAAPSADDDDAAPIA